MWVRYGWGVVRQQHLEVVGTDLVPILQGVGERRSKPVLQELTVCVAPGPI